MGCEDVHIGQSYRSVLGADLHGFGIHTVKNLQNLIHQFSIFLCDLHTASAPGEEIVRETLESLLDHDLGTCELATPSGMPFAHHFRAHYVVVRAGKPFEA